MKYGYIVQDKYRHSRSWVMYDAFSSKSEALATVREALSAGVISSRALSISGDEVPQIKVISEVSTSRDTSRRKK